VILIDSIRYVKIVIFYQHFDFDQDLVFGNGPVNRDLVFGRKFRSLTLSSIFDENFDF